MAECCIKCAVLYVYIRVCVCVWVCCRPAAQMDSRPIVCDAALSILGSSSLLIYHSCIVFSTRLYLRCTNVPPLHVSDCGRAHHEGFVTGGGGGERYEQENLRGRRR